MNFSKLKTEIILSLAGAIMVSCASPTGNLQAEIEQFKKEFPNHILTYQGKNRPMNYAWSGDVTQRPIIFVHGSPGSWDGWVHFLRDPELQKRFQLIAIDRPGYGGSGEGTTETSLAHQAQDVLEVLQFNQSHLPAILVGHSYGGPVIARAAMDHPEQVSGLVFVASSVDPDLESTKWYQYPANWWPIKKIIPDALRVCNEEILPLKGELQEMLNQWKKISAKAVIIQGEKDDLVPPENADFLVKNLDSKVIVKVHRVSSMNHFVPWQHPELILEGIQEINSTIH